MTSPIDVEVTSNTTARVSGAGVDSVDLSAAADEEIQQVVHRFVTTLARDNNETVEVVYRREDRRRFITVAPDGTTAQSEPSGPIQTVPSETEADEHDPVVLTAEPIAYRQPPPRRAPSTPQPRQVQEPDRPRIEIRPPLPSAAADPRTAPIVSLTAPRTNLAAGQPARLGIRGRLNAVLGLKLTPKTASSEMRLRESESVIVGPIPDGATVTVANVKGGAGKTPISVGLASTLAIHRGAGSVACADLAEVGGSLADRVAVPPAAGQDVLALLADLAMAGDLRPGTLSRYLARQPSGEDIAAGSHGALAGLGYDDAAKLASILGRYRDILIADTGNNPVAGSWQWAIDAAHVLVVPVPLRRDAAAAAQRMLNTIAVARPDVLGRTVVVITDGPGDAPMVEAEAVEAFASMGLRVCRMPFEPLFASGERIVASQLRRQTSEALTVLAAAVVELMAAAAG